MNRDKPMMNRNKVMMIGNMILLATLMFLLNFLTDAAPMQTKELPDMVPGKLDWDYIGNSFSDFAVDAENGVGHSGRATARQTHAPDRSQPGRRRQSLGCPAL